MKMPFQTRLSMTAAAVLLTLNLTGCSGDSKFDRNTKPVALGVITQTTYDGSTDDLLTAGLGKSGLAAADQIGRAHV